MPNNKTVSQQELRQQLQRLEKIYNDFSRQFAALKKEKNDLVKQIMRKIDDEKIKVILTQIK